jgi:phosphatidyl-myo-inositol dimannoside synthase
MQRYGRVTAAALCHYASVNAQDAEILSLNDPIGFGVFQVGTVEYRVRGFGRHKFSLILHLLRRARRIDIIFIGHANMGPIGMTLRALNPTLRYWVAAHGVEVWEPLTFARRFALRTARGVIAVSGYTATRVASIQGVDDSKIAVLHNVLDPMFASELVPDPTSSSHDKRPILLTVGRLDKSEPGKGVDTVIRALPAVLRKFPDTLYLVVGRGDQVGQLQRLAMEFGVLNNVQFVGEVDEAALRALYYDADVFVMPSRQEGFGIVFLEAMAYGKPVIGGNHGGTVDVVEEGVTGFLVDPSDVASLEERLIRLLSDKHLRSDMGLAGNRRVQEHFTFEHYVAQLAELLRRR